jgi:uncharacterized protein (TIGR02265 family)
MATTPEIKASYFRANLDALAVLGNSRATVEAQMATEIETTRRASRADWLPMAFDEKLSAVVAEVAGRDGVIATNRAAFLAAAEGPFLRPVVQGALRVFGVTPKGILRHLDNTWDAGTRHAGRMEVVLGEHEATIHHRGMVAAEAWHLGFVGLLQGVLELTGFDGTVDMRRADDGHPIYDVRWQTRKTP